MSEETISNVEVKPSEPVKDESLDKARDAERTRYTREESLRRELEDNKRRLAAIKSNGWDLDILEKKAQNEVVKSDVDVKKEIEDLRNQIQSERSRRSEMEELQGIVDFTHKSADKYELIKNLEDSPKFIRIAMQEHYKNTGKHLSYEEACDYIETEIEKAEIGRFEKFSKTKKAEKIYKLPKAEDSKKPSSQKYQDKPAPTAATYEVPKVLTRSNTKEAFQYFKKKHGF
jgi:hypothetical protein